MVKLNKRKLMKLQWRGFETYPKHGERIVLHIEGTVPRENKILHDFKLLTFNAFTFNPKTYLPINDPNRAAWKFSWLSFKETLPR